MHYDQPLITLHDGDIRTNGRKSLRHATLFSFGTGLIVVLSPGILCAVLVLKPKRDAVIH